MSIETINFQLLNHISWSNLSVDSHLNCFVTYAYRKIMRKLWNYPSKQIYSFQQFQYHLLLIIPWTISKDKMYIEKLSKCVAVFKHYIVNITILSNFLLLKIENSWIARKNKWEMNTSYNTNKKFEHLLWWV